jgi:hypothetical protein
MELFDAIETENVEELRRLLENGADPNTILDGRFSIITPLYDATMTRNTELVRLLLKHGANPNFIEKRHSGIETGIFGNVFHEDIEIIKLLLEYGADPNIPWLINPAGGSRLYPLQIFLNQHFEPDDGMTIDEFKEKKLESLRLLLKYGADPSKINYSGRNYDGSIPNGENALDISRDNYNSYGPQRGYFLEEVQLIKNHMDLQRAQQNLAFASSLNPRLGYDTPINDLDYDSMIDMLGNPIRSYNHSLNLRMRDEKRRDKLTKSRQRSAFMRGMETTTGPFSARGVRYEPNIMEGISRHLSTMRPNTIAQRNMRLEDENDRIADYLNTLEQYGMGKHSGKRSGKRSKKLRKNKYYTRRRF